MHVGSTVRNVCVPMELCYLPAGQSTNRKCTPKVVSEIIRYSATSTSERKEKIVNLLNRIQFDTAGTVLQFGVNVKKTFENVDARVINPPEIAYNGRSSRPSKGVWRQDGKFMVTQSAPIKWTILNFDDRNNFPSLVAFKDMMMKSAKQQNVMLADVESSSIQTIRVNDDIDSVLKKYMQNGYKFLVVIIQDRNDNYAKVKQSAELRCGILTQCEFLLEFYFSFVRFLIIPF